MQNKLTDTQKQLVLSFFEDERHPLSRSIAEKLISTGKCVVPGKTCIWIGLIGNFIKTSDFEEGYGCLLYSFDLEYFMSSSFFKERLKHVLEKAEKEQYAIALRVKELKELEK
jgi:hypothetical protein